LSPLVLSVTVTLEVHSAIAMVSGAASGAAS
jgi:hypothetical protein